MLRQQGQVAGTHAVNISGSAHVFSPDSSFTAFTYVVGSVTQRSVWKINRSQQYVKRLQTFPSGRKISL